MRINKNIVLGILLAIAAAIYVVLINNHTEKNIAKLTKIASLTEKLNASYANEWEKFSKINEANAFVFETYRPCISANHSLLCRSAAVHLATMSRSESFGKQVDQSIVESIKTVRYDDAINGQIEAIMKESSN